MAEWNESQMGWNELSFDGAVFGLRCAQMAPGVAE